MKTLRRFTYVVFCCVPLIGHADDNSPEIDYDFNGSSIDWSGKTDRTYFVLSSDELVDWAYFPIIYAGEGSELSHGFNLNSPQGFLRLLWTDIPDNGDPNTADFDFDGLGSLAELNNSLQTDPLNPDTDGDSMKDGWEIAHGYDPTDPDENNNNIDDGLEDTDNDDLADFWELAYAGNLTILTDGDVDTDSDGIRDKFESQQGTDPNVDQTSTGSVGIQGITYDSNGRLDEISGYQPLIFDFDNEGNIETAN